jgi:endonuclease YncB( thermonuclease family)
VEPQAKADAIMTAGAALMREVHRFVVASLVFAVSVVGSSYASTFDAPVVRVVDGDSLIVLVDGQQMRVRLKEIDAPELKQPFGKRSRQSLTDLCASKRARVMWTEKDRNGRLLARVWCSGVDANAEQVRRGMAWVCSTAT